MTQTDAEIVALVALVARAIRERFPLVLKYEAENLASVAVAALTEAGRLRGVDRKVRDAIEHLLLFVEQGEHGWTIEGKAVTVRAWLDAEPTPWR